MILSFIAPLLFILYTIVQYPGTPMLIFMYALGKATYLGEDSFRRNKENYCCPEKDAELSPNCQTVEPIEETRQTNIKLGTHARMNTHLGKCLNKKVMEKANDGKQSYNE